MAQLDYIQRIVCAGGQWAAFPVNGVSSIEVAHDDHCWLLRGGRTCTCVPDITVTAPTGVFVIDAKGRPTKIGKGGK
jgi:hypothetical protein